jgi:hypothetical protein
MEEACFLFLMNEIGRGGRKRPRQTEIERQKKRKKEEKVLAHTRVPLLSEAERMRGDTQVSLDLKAMAGS